MHRNSHLFLSLFLSLTFLFLMLKSPTENSVANWLEFLYLIKYLINLYCREYWFAKIISSKQEVFLFTTQKTYTTKEPHISPIWPRIDQTTN